MSSLTLNISSDTAEYMRISRPTTPISKPLLVFLHYWGGSSSTWHKLSSPDSQTSLSTTYPTLALDLRGWGKSTGPSDANRSLHSYSISQLAFDVASTLHHIHSNTDTKDLLTNGFVLIGHSMGARISLATLSILSPRLLCLSKGLVLIAPPPPVALEPPSELKEQQKVVYQSEQSIRWTVENVLSNPDRLSKERHRQDHPG